MNQVAKVLIADDHALYREGLREIIERWEDFSVVGEAQNGQEAIDLSRVIKPDLILMDIKMPVMDGITALSKIKEESPNLIVVMLSVYEGEDEILSAIRHGARGYILKNCYSNQLHERLRNIMEGNCSLSEEAVTRCVEYIQKTSDSGGFMDSSSKSTLELLTEHERQLLLCIVSGASNKEIGKRLYISESTVKKQISFLLMKLNLENRVQAAAFAFRSGLTE